MIIKIDTSVVPPRVALDEADDFRALEVVVEIGGHAWVAPETLARLAGDAAVDPDWQARFDAMLAFASGKGWTDAAGHVRAHVEIERPGLRR